MNDLVSRLAPVGLSWQPNGQVVLTGPLLRLAHDCEQAFGVLAEQWRAEPEEYPALLDAQALQSVDFLTSFPQLASFAGCLDPAESNLAEFTADPLGPTGVRLTRLAPVRDVLTPAACYHVYTHHRGASFTAARYVRTRNTCFRRETHYLPLRRQWNFRMWEVVCLGTRLEVTDFVRTATAAATALFEELALPVDWAAATDPFFRPASNPKYLAQRVAPTKHEACYGDLAIGSVNLHEDSFGRAYDITRDGIPVTTGCLAFGLERWLYALTDRHGTDPAGWPDVTAAARRVTAAAGAR